MLKSPPASDAALNGNQSPKNKPHRHLRQEKNLDVVILTMEGFRAAFFGDDALAESYFAAAETACALAIARMKAAR